MRMTWQKWTMGALAVIAGCSASNRATEIEGASTSSPTSAAGAVHEHVNARISRHLPPETRQRVAFRRGMEGWGGGFHGYETRVSELGEIHFTPHPMSLPELSTTRTRRLSPRTSRPTRWGDEVRLTTLGITRGSAALAPSLFGVREAEGQMLIDRGPVREVVENAAGGVEQQWEFDTKPGGTGDLLVRIGVANAAYRAETDKGLAFADTKGVGITYGYATWVDASGTRTRVSTRYYGDAIELRVPHELVETSAYPASLDPLVMPGTPTDATFLPMTASLRTQNLVVWESYTHGYSNLKFSFTNDSDGQIDIGVYNRQLSSESYAQYDAQVAPAGPDHYVVVWVDERNGKANIRIKRIATADGSTSNEIAVAPTTANEQYRPMVACVSATNCLVGWNEYTPAIAEVRAALVNPSDGTAAAALNLNPNPSYDEYAAQVGTDGTHYLVAWEAQVNATDWIIKSRTVSGSGALGGATIEASSGTLEYAPTIVFDGTHYLIGYTHWDGSQEDVKGQRLTVGNAKTGGEFTIAGGGGDQGFLKFARDGSTSILAVYYHWVGEYDVHARSITPATGTSLGSEIVVTSAAGRQFAPSVSRGTGSNFYITYSDKQTGTDKAMGTRATLSQVVAPLVTLADGPARCDAVSLSSSPTAPQLTGTTVQLSASATCTAGQTPEYEFAIDSGSGYVVKRAFGTASTFSWNTTGFSGTPQIRVRTRKVGSAAPYEGEAFGTFALTGKCTSVSLGLAPASPQTVGATVVATASATCSPEADGGASTPEYQFYLYSGSTWTLVRDWSTSSSWTWDTSTYYASTFTLQVRVRRQGNASFDSYVQAGGYQLLGPGCSTLAVSASPTSPVAAGTPVTVTGTASCTGGATAEYQVYQRLPTGTWLLLQNWGASGSYNWSTAGALNGTHYFQVRARSVGSTLAYEALTQIPFTISGGVDGCTGADFTTSPSGSATAGSAVAINATASCGASTPLYQFYVQAPGGYWQLLQGYSTSASATWTTSAAKGTGQIQVRVKAQSSPQSYDSMKQKAFVLN